MNFKEEMKKLEGFAPEDKDEREHLIEDAKSMMRILKENGGIEDYGVEQNGSIWLRVNEELTWEDNAFEDKMQGLRQTHSFVLGMYTFMMAMSYRAEKQALEFEKKLKEQQANAPRILIPQTIPPSPKQTKLIL